MLTPPLARWRAAFVTALVVAGAVSCGDSTTAPPPPPVTLTVLPSLADVAVGHVLHTQVTAASASGTQLNGRQYTYTSANPGVATVDGSGIITGVAPGTTTIKVATPGGSFTVPTSVATLGTGAFRIDVRFLGTVSPALRAAAMTAAARWEQAVTQPLVPYQVITNVGDCGAGIPALNESVQNMIIYVAADSIDGPANTVGQGGPCVLRDDAPQLTAVGTLQVDSADIAPAANSGVLIDLLTHEMGHILGIGTVWGSSFFPNTATGLGVGSTCGADPEFIGHAARVASAALGFTSDSTKGVPIENTGGPGTCDGHWRGTVFGHELMTGTLHRDANPMSLVTIEALSDLGYGVAPEAAADFSVLNATHPTTFPSPAPSVGIRINEHVTGPRFTVTRSGQLNPIRARIVPTP